MTPPKAPSPTSRKTAAGKPFPSPVVMCKLQWKPDMGMRWAALGVDYEMYGKDHLAGAALQRHLQDRRRHAARTVYVRDVPG